MSGLRSFISSSSNDQSADTLFLGEKESHHLVRVLRAKEGDEVEVLDGKGSAWQTIITKAHKSTTELKVVSYAQETSPSPVYHLHIALPKQKKMDQIVQQATELGIAHIYPMQTDHSELKIKKGEETERVEQWQRTGIEASKQSGNRFVPTIHPIKRLVEEDMKESAAGEVAFLASLDNEAKLVSHYRSIYQDVREIHFYVGPEGDFSGREYDWFSQKDIHPITLGKTVLRVETAVVSACSQLQAIFPLV